MPPNGNATIVVESLMNGGARAVIGAAVTRLDDLVNSRAHRQARTTLCVPESRLRLAGGQIAAQVR
jgi:hypothetical protein